MLFFLANHLLHAGRAKLGNEASLETSSIHQSIPLENRGTDRDAPGGVG